MYLHNVVRKHTLGILNKIVEITKIMAFYVLYFQLYHKAIVSKEMPFFLKKKLVLRIFLCV